MTIVQSTAPSLNRQNRRQLSRQAAQSGAPKVSIVRDPRMLPMLRKIADQFSLRYHVGLDCLRRGNGTPGAVQAMLEMLLAAGFLTCAGHGEISRDLALAAERAVREASQRGRAKQTWHLDDADFRTLCRIIRVHDFQLYNAPLEDVMHAFKKVNALAGWDGKEPPAEHREMVQVIQIVVSGIRD